MKTILTLLDRSALTLFNFLVIAGAPFAAVGAGHQRALVGAAGAASRLEASSPSFP